MKASKAARFQAAGGGTLNRGSRSVCLCSSLFSSRSRARRDAERRGGKSMSVGEGERDDGGEGGSGVVGSRSYLAGIMCWSSCQMSICFSWSLRIPKTDFDSRRRKPIGWTSGNSSENGTFPE